MAERAAFATMRAGLVARGLLTPDFRLTEAGNSHAARLIETLRASEAAGDPSNPRVRWNTKRCGPGWREPADG